MYFDKDMKQRSKHQPELFWPRVVMRKWLNISTKDSDFSADEDDFDIDSDSDSDSEAEGFGQRGRQSRLVGNRGDDAQVDLEDDLPRLRRRRKSETFRAQYINNEEVRICVGTWNVGGKLPPDDLDIDDWLNNNEPADIYVLGLQEIVPLNAGNIFGAEDSRPVPRWENIIRETLNRIRPKETNIKSFSDPPSPSKYKPSDDIPDIEEEIFLESDSDVGDEVHPLDEESNDFDEGKDRSITEQTTYVNSGVSDCPGSAILGFPGEEELQGQFSSPKRLDRLNCLRTEHSENVETPVARHSGKLTKILSGSERIGLSWPEPPLNLLSQRVLERPNSFRSVKSFKAPKSFTTYSSFKSTTNEVPPQIALLAEIDLKSLLKRKRRSPFVRIVSKQMVGIFLTIWVRRSLRRHIRNLKVSTVGVGVMGYIGNKGSISVSMSIHQTFFCFICTHLTSGEKDGDELKRNTDVHEILRRTRFHSVSDSGLPGGIHNHEYAIQMNASVSIKSLKKNFQHFVMLQLGQGESTNIGDSQYKPMDSTTAHSNIRIIWLGDLNYRINLPYEKTQELISNKEWSKLVEKDQLVQELKKGRAFDGWSEGTLRFPPTYKYEINSEKYYGEDPKAGRRTPAWCDRVLSYGKGLKLLSYRRTELKLSDHRPVTATYMAEVEVFSPRKLQRALTFTDAEIEREDV
ncbi:type IV inositol polyphosphate 5-phosphatase 3 isoform X2 [Carya illinoinensis]|uniref:type IV inositol polyphosphate 5-phosphatase 3 isoform X2 n=1 Tax=Carya illinoinensis TaxID=32201 RepID=UPI001C717D93|nr:type IV inositol polyphosphate 5-phosphatase 3 isoform X2 [Carya illinoinensis]